MLLSSWLRQTSWARAIPEVYCGRKSCVLERSGHPQVRLSEQRVARSCPRVGTDGTTIWRDKGAGTLVALRLLYQLVLDSVCLGRRPAGPWQVSSRTRWYGPADVFNPYAGDMGYRLMNTAKAGSFLVFVHQYCKVLRSLVVGLCKRESRRPNDETHACRMSILQRNETFCPRCSSTR